MEKKQYLTEDAYERGKKKLKKIALIILIAGLLIGIGLILYGIISQGSAKKINEERYKEAYELSQKKVDEANARLEEIENQKKTLNEQIETKEYSCNSLNMMDPNWFADKTKCQGEVSSLRSELNELEMEKFELENANYTVYYDKVLPIKYIIFYILGGSVILVSAFVAGIIYLIVKRREITAFAVQQTMPLAQEGIEKMAPTVGNAVGGIAGSIAKGIKDGLKDDEK